MSGEIFPLPNEFSERAEYPDDIELENFISGGTWRRVLWAINEADTYEHQVALAHAVAERLNKQLENRHLVVDCSNVVVKGHLPRHDFNSRAKKGDLAIMHVNQIKGGLVQEFAPNRYVDEQNHIPVYRQTLMMVLVSPNGYVSTNHGHVQQRHGQAVHYGVDLHSAEVGSIKVIEDRVV